MVRLVRAARRGLRRLVGARRGSRRSAVDRRPAPHISTDLIDIELTAREDMRIRPRVALGGAHRWWGA